MLFGINESTTEMVAVEEMYVPAHLAESFEGIAALGNNQAEKLYEEVINAQGEFSAKLQRGVSTGKLQEACAEIIQEGALANFISKAKELFKKLWAALKALFNKFMTWLDSKMKSDKDFIAKYKQILSKKATEVSDMTYKGHNWGEFDPARESGNLEKAVNEAGENGENGANAAAGDAKEGEAQTGDAKDGEKKDAEAGKKPAADGSDREARIDQAMKDVAKLVGVTETTESADIVSEYREKLYGGSVEAEELTGPNVSSLISIVESYSKDKTAAEKLFKAAEREYNKTIRGYEKTEKAAAKSSTATLDMSTSTLIAVSKAEFALVNQLNGVYLAALKARRDESKSILAKVITYKKSK